MRNVSFLLREIRRQRGIESESAVHKVLEGMKRKREIASFYKTSQGDDKFKGINFVIIGIQGNGILFQVKSSFAGAKKHSKQFPGVPVIIADAKNPEITERRIRSLIHQT